QIFGFERHRSGRLAILCFGRRRTLTMRLYITAEVDVLVIAAHDAAFGGHGERRLSGLHHPEWRLRQPDAVVVGKMIAAHRGQRLDGLAAGVEVDRTKIAEKQVGSVPSRPCTM